MWCEPFILTTLHPSSSISAIALSISYPSPQHGYIILLYAYYRVFRRIMLNDAPFLPPRSTSRHPVMLPFPDCLRQQVLPAKLPFLRKGSDLVLWALITVFLCGPFWPSGSSPFSAPFIFTHSHSSGSLQHNTKALLLTITITTSFIIS